MIFEPKKRDFLKITIDEFVKKTIESNPDLNANELKKSPEEFKKQKFKGDLYFHCKCNFLVNCDRKNFFSRTHGKGPIISSS